MNILKNLAHFIDNHTRYGNLYDFSGMVLEFENSLINELDFTKEGQKAEAAIQATTVSILPILISGSILSAAGYCLCFTSSISAIADLEGLIGRGALLSIFQ